LLGLACGLLQRRRGNAFARTMRRKKAQPITEEVEMGIVWTIVVIALVAAVVLWLLRRA